MLTCTVACQKDNQHLTEESTTPGNTEDSTSNSEEIETNHDCEIIQTYDNGRLLFTMDDKIYSGIINTKGEIIYSSEERNNHSSINWTPIGNGAGYITKYSGNDKIYILFNEDGDNTLTVNGDLFDTVIGYGDGMILVYKNTSTISNSEYSYGVLDSNGNWVKELTARKYLPNPSELYSNWKYFEYMGNGIFITSESAFKGKDYVIYNVYTDKAYYINSGYVLNEYSSNGIIYGKSADWCMFGDYDNMNESNYTYLPRYFAINPDGTFEEVSSFTDAYNDLLIDRSGEYMSILNKSNNTKKEYTNFPARMISSIKFDGDFGLVSLNGADGKKYFTVIDKECNQMIEPIVCLSAEISEGRIVYKNADDIFEVITVNGTTVISKEEGYKYIGIFNNGLANAENNNGKCFIDIDGNIISLKIK